MPELDLTPTTRRLADLIAGIPDERLGAPTPCPDYTVGDIVDHVGGLAQAFTAAASKAVHGATAAGGSGDARRLGPDWRKDVARHLGALAEAWQNPMAWTGMTAAGGIEMPGDVAGLVALDELVIHGWDLARATAQPYHVDPPSLDAEHDFVAQFSGPGQEASREGLFGPVVPVADDAPLLDRVIGLTGRDPGWSPA